MNDVVSFPLHRAHSVYNVALLVSTAGLAPASTVGQPFTAFRISIWSTMTAVAHLTGDHYPLSARSAAKYPSDL